MLLYDSVYNSIHYSGYFSKISVPANSKLNDKLNHKPTTCRLQMFFYVNRCIEFRQNPIRHNIRLWIKSCIGSKLTVITFKLLRDGKLTASPNPKDYYASLEQLAWDSSDVHDLTTEFDKTSTFSQHCAMKNRNLGVLVGGSTSVKCLLFYCILA